MTAIIAALGGLAGIIKILTPVLTALVGWIIPSPFQKTEKGQADIHAAETKAQSSRGNVSNLDNLP